jgi:hypothetical protein
MPVFDEAGCKNLTDDALEYHYSGHNTLNVNPNFTYYYRQRLQKSNVEWLSQTAWAS